MVTATPQRPVKRLYHSLIDASTSHPTLMYYSTTECSNISNSNALCTFFELEIYLLEKSHLEPWACYVTVTLLPKRLYFQQNDRFVGLFQRNIWNHVEENNLVCDLLSESAPWGLIPHEPCNLVSCSWHSTTTYSTVLSGILTAKFVIDVIDGWNITWSASGGWYCNTIQ